MRKLYNAIKVDLKCIKNCEETYYLIELYNYKEDQLLQSIYEKLTKVFIKNKEKSESKFILVRCQILDEILDYFLCKGIVNLKNGGRIDRKTEYEVPREDENIKKNNSFFYAQFSDEHSVRIDRQKHIENGTEDSRIDDI